MVQSNVFGIGTNFTDYSKIEFPNSIKLITKGKKYGYIDRNIITKNKELIDTHKVLLSAAYGGDLVNPFYAGPGECCTATYLVMGIFDTEIEANNYIAYMKTNFFMFLLKLKKYTQHRNRQVYSYIPLLSVDKIWTDTELYEKYGFTTTDIEFINSITKTKD